MATIPKVWKAKFGLDIIQQFVDKQTLATHPTLYLHHMIIIQIANVQFGDDRDTHPFSLFCQRIFHGRRNPFQYVYS